VETTERYLGSRQRIIHAVNDKMGIELDVLGMLVSSAKSSYDACKNEVAEMSSEIVVAEVEAGLDRIWPSETSRAAELRPGDHAEIAVDQLDLLTPKNEKQTAAKAQALSAILALRQTQWLLFLRAEQNAVPLPLLVIVVSWLAAIFASLVFLPQSTPP